MNELKMVLEKYKKTVISFVLGLIISGTVVIAYSVYANAVNYDNTTSEMTSTNVKDALDELYAKAESCTKIKNNTVYFAFGKPTINSTTDYTTLNKNVFIAKNGSQKSVCIIRNNELYCFDNNNWNIEKKHIQQAFSGVSCSVTSSTVNCDDSNLLCTIYSNGRVYCRDYNAQKECNLYNDGSVNCV